ncbi:hypothetical protein [Corynebacterium jeikeium]|uniref:hypothetical protein n=1 Tax=Corynebacterium jeikeium TaxID=38289 RepID=UPI0005581D9E|nr:hypothetical protein [Corynebacterium jeikeium]
MKFKKSLITLAAASSVALAGVPAAVADDAAEAPVAADVATQPAADEAAPAEDATAGDDQAEADDEAEAGETADENAEDTENEGSTEEGTQGSIDDEKKEKLKGSIDKLVGWDDSTSTLDKVKDVIGFIGKIVKIFL